ncbi:MAG: hypothetical protein LUF30_07820 [Lachnospiraceae bacterium]|nr:hypothetical protein [Lachnospiraceae bacterium]
MNRKMVGVCVSALMLALNMTANAQEAGAVELTVTSDILGLADTGNKTTLKADLIYTSGPGDINIYYYNEDGERVIYEDQEEQCVAMDPVTYSGSAVLDLGSGVDDSLIDCSEAVVELIDGNGYSANELILSESASVLDGEWSNGQYVYTLDVGALEWNTWDYDTTVDYNSGREWSIMGGDGNGTYFFTFQVSGIRYDGGEVAAATFPVTVYIYGRSCIDIAASAQFVENTYDKDYTSGVEQTDEVQWNWYTENETSYEDGKPYMNDTYSDYFSVIWPEGTDASAICAEDVEITLYSKYGDAYTLSTETVYGEKEYAVVAGEGETQVIVTYQQWALVPVYSTMEICVSCGDLEASVSYDICSVVAYMVQTGGGGVTVDHTVTCYNYYGLKGLTLENAANTGYTLSVEMENEEGEQITYYYAEDEDGNGYLSEAVTSTNAFGRNTTSIPEDAWTGDGTEIYNIAVIENVLFVETRVDSEDETVTTETKTVDGEEIIFTRSISAKKDPDEILADGAYLDDGYNMEGSLEKCAWSMRYQSGWTTSTPEPDSLPYMEGYYPYGYEAGSSNPIYDSLNE